MLHPHMPRVQVVSSQTFQASDFPCKEEEFSRYFINYKRKATQSKSLPLDRRSKAAPEIWSHSCWNKLWAYATAWQTAQSRAGLAWSDFQVASTKSASPQLCQLLQQPWVLTESCSCPPHLICPMHEAFTKDRRLSTTFKPVTWSKAQKRDSTEVRDRGIKVHFLPGNLAWLGVYAEVDFNWRDSGGVS